MKTILCVDDDPPMLRFYRSFLALYGYAVLTAEGGRQALEILHGQAVDCVLLDFSMPEMDGAAVAAEIKRQDPATPILLVSGCPTAVPESALAFLDGVADKTDLCRSLLPRIERLLRSAA